MDYVYAYNSFFNNIKNIIKFNRNNDEYYSNIDSVSEAKKELRILYRFKDPLATKLYADGKNLSNKKKKKLEKIERRIQLLFNDYPHLRKLK